MNDNMLRLLEKLMHLRLVLLRELMRRPDAPDLRNKFREQTAQVMTLRMQLGSTKKVH